MASSIVSRRPTQAVPHTERLCEAQIIPSLSIKPQTPDAPESICCQSRDVLFLRSGSHMAGAQLVATQSIVCWTTDAEAHLPCVHSFGPCSTASPPPPPCRPTPSGVVSLTDSCPADISSRVVSWMLCVVVAAGVNSAVRRRTFRAPSLFSLLSPQTSVFPTPVREKEQRDTQGHPPVCECDLNAIGTSQNTPGDDHLIPHTSLTSKHPHHDMRAMSLPA